MNWRMKSLLAASLQGTTTNPKFSPDGKWIAFSADYGGNMDACARTAAGSDAPPGTTSGTRTRTRSA